MKLLTTKQVGTVLGSMVLSFGILSACGTEEEKEVKNVTVAPTEEIIETSESNEDNMEVGKVIADDDAFKVVLNDIVTGYDADYDYEYGYLNFEVENRTDKLVTFQVEELSIDGKMVDYGNQSMSQDVSAGKMADAELSLDYATGELPEFKESVELIIEAFDEDYNTVREYPVTIELN